MTLTDQVRDLLTDALRAAQAAGRLPDVPVDEVTVERPQNPEHGDFATSTPMKLARVMRRNPFDIAEAIASSTETGGILASVEAARPGFVNLRLNPAWLAEQVDAIREAGDGFGSVQDGVGTRVQVEFVSVNPTGPIHVGHGRGAVFGSSLANVLEAAGYDVQREYYINDAGNQMDKFNRSVYARYVQASGGEAEVPEDGYSGDYLVDLAGELTGGVRRQVHRHGRGPCGVRDRRDRDEPDDRRHPRGHGGAGSPVRRVVQREEPVRQRPVQDRDGDARNSGLDRRARGCDVVRHDQARRRKGQGAHSRHRRADVLSPPTWHTTTTSSSCAGFDRVINIWGADHQGQVPFMQQLADVLGVSRESLVLLIYQLVTLKQAGEAVRFSKRAGQIVTLRELVEEVGADACRFFFLQRAPESQMEFDIELAKEQSEKNPVYYIQYAHARIASILRLADERGIDFADGDTSLLTHEAELSLIRTILRLPELVSMMARNLEPHHLTYYSMDLATEFHNFYQQCRVVSSDPADVEITKARLKLVEATKGVLARCLTLMGMTAPEVM